VKEGGGSQYRKKGGLGVSGTRLGEHLSLLGKLGAALARVVDKLARQERGPLDDLERKGMGDKSACMLLQ
jgi:hypothetical protein